MSGQPSGLARLFVNGRRTQLSTRACITALAALTAVATPTVVQACTTKAQAYAGSMKINLHEVARAQYAYLAAHGHFTTDLDSLGLKLYTGVRLTIEHADSVRWAAFATHNWLPGGSCRIGGRAVADGGVARLDEVVCVIPPYPLTRSELMYRWSMPILLILALIASVVSRGAASMRGPRRMLIALVLLAPITSLFNEPAYCRWSPHWSVMASCLALGAYLLVRGLRGRRPPSPI